MLRRFVPGALGLGALQVNTMIDGLIATWPLLVGPTLLGFDYPLDKSSGAVLGYTQRLYQFPLGVFGIAVATAVFPSLSRAAGDAPLFASIVRRGVRLSLFIGLPASVGLMIVRRDLCSVVFEGGDFSAAGVDRAAWVLLGYAGAVWSYSVNHTLIRAFYARGDLRTPLFISLTTVGLNFLGNITFIWIPGVGEAGLAWSTALTSCLQTALLSRALRRSMPEGRLLQPDDRASVARCALASLAMALPTVAVVALLPVQDAWTGRFVRLLAALAVGAIAYGAMVAALRMPELRWLLARRGRAPDEPVSPPA
jgi:putative peptidoglycan lipid II flippase